MKNPNTKSASVEALVARALQGSGSKHGFPTTFKFERGTATIPKNLTFSSPVKVSRTFLN
jgi:hypothetical protein